MKAGERMRQEAPNGKSAAERLLEARLSRDDPSNDPSGDGLLEALAYLSLQTARDVRETKTAVERHDRILWLMSGLFMMVVLPAFLYGLSRAAAAIETLLMR